MSYVQLGGFSGSYLAEVTSDGVTYEAWVRVHADGDADFSTQLAYINDEAYPISEVPAIRQDDLLDDAIEQYRTDNNADAIYEAMRDGCFR